jgi:hypothetical protein
MSARRPDWWWYLEPWAHGHEWVPGRVHVKTAQGRTDAFEQIERQQQGRETGRTGE